MPIVLCHPSVYGCPDACLAATHLSQINCCEWELERYSAYSKLWDLDRQRLLYIPVYTVILRLPWNWTLSLTASWDPCTHVSLSPAPYDVSPVFLLSDSEEFLCPPSFGFKIHSVKWWLSSHYHSLNRLLAFVLFPKDNLLVTKSHLQMSVFSLRKTEQKDFGEWSAISL